MTRPGAHIGRLLGAVAIAAGVGLAVAPVAAASTGPVAASATPVAAASAASAPAASGPLVGRALAAKDRLDRTAAALPSTVSSWYVDDATGRLVVDVAGTPSAPLLAALTGTDPAAVAVVGSAAPVEALAAADLTGGQTITNSGVRCSLGFAARRTDGSFLALTAGHCTKTAGTWAGYNRAAIGPVAATSYPKQDFGAVSLTNTAAWTPRGQVAGGPAVKGSAAAAVGAQVCRSGSTTGYRCGTVTAKNVTVNYGNGITVSGLTKTSACAEHGDSGGSFITPAGQAQGLAAAGSGTCSSGGASYFQPIAPVLAALKVSLVLG